MRLGTLILLCWRGAGRPRLREPGGTLAGIMSIALGVSVFLAVTIANRSAVGSFRNAFGMVAGRADLEIRGRIPEEILPNVMALRGVRGATPLVEAVVTLPEYPGESLRLEGIDPFTAPGLLGFEPPATGKDSSSDLAEWLSGNDLLAVSPSFLAQHNQQAGNWIRVQGPGAPRRMRLTTISDSQGVGAAHVAATDIAAAQEWVGKPQELSAILIRLDPLADRETMRARLRTIVPGDASVEPPARRTGRVESMIAAFRLNLTALSLVSLLVGMYFVGNAALASVVRQRVSLGILRAVGTGRREIMALVLAEASLTGIAGAAVGVLLSRPLAGIMAAPVARTVSALYLPVDAQGGWPTMSEALAGAAAGLTAALFAAWIPARQAARMDPTRILHPGSAPEIFRVRAGLLAGWGVGLLGLAFLASLAALNGFSSLYGFAAAFLVLAGGSLLVPSVMEGLAGVCRRLPLHGSAGALIRLSLGQSLRAMHRTAPTAAALAAAAAMTVGIGVMIHSFRGSVVDWVGKTLAADLFIAPAANELVGLEHTLPPTAEAWWIQRPEVESVGTFRELEARTTKGEPVTLGLVAGPARGTVDFLHGDSEKKSATLGRGGCTALSESLARRLGLGPGDDLILEGPTGAVRLRILDLYRDYTRDRGIAMVGASSFRKSWKVPGEHSLAVKFRADADANQREGARREFLRDFGGKEAFACYANAALRERILAIFDQTFAITAILRSIAVAVAVGGVLLTLGILVLERTRDLGVLRAIGAAPRQVSQLMLVEAGFLGLVASGVGLLSGIGLALVLTFVINRVFFGWTIDLSFPWWELGALPLWMIATALVAGVIPAQRASAVKPAAALRME
jgi:putative ABC transport system permease protein